MGSAWPGRGGGQYRPEGCRATSYGIGAEGPGIDFSACSSPTRRMPGPYKCYLDTEACSEGSVSVQWGRGRHYITASPAGQVQADRRAPFAAIRELVNKTAFLNELTGSLRRLAASLRNLG